jgi:hypothetical protein
MDRVVRFLLMSGWSVAVHGMAGIGSENAGEKRDR